MKSMKARLEALERVGGITMSEPCLIIGKFFAGEKLGWAIAIRNEPAGNPLMFLPLPYGEAQMHPPTAAEAQAVATTLNDMITKEMEGMAKKLASHLINATERDEPNNPEAKLVADRLIVFLEQQCDKCKGAGSLTSEAWAKWTEAFEYHRKQGQSVKDATDAVGAFPEGPEKVKCSACVGGKVPTQAGKKILDFVAKYQAGAAPTN